jgi:hypothetical protein
MLLANRFGSFDNFSQNLSIVSYNVTNFGQALTSGSFVMSSFFDGVSSLSNSVLEYSKQAFDEATKLEVDRIAGGGAISAGFDNLIDYTKGLQVFDNVRTKLAITAAEKPGVTSDYTNAASLLNDDIAAALNKTGRSSDQLTKVFENITPKLIENLVLNSKLYGQGIPMSAVTRSFAKLLDTGKIQNKEIFFSKNPLLKSAIAKYEKENGKLTGMNKEKRLFALNDIFSSTFSKQQLDALQNAFATRIEGLRSYVLDPDIGLFGFNRKFKNPKDPGSEITFFQVLANAASPFIDALAESAKLITAFADPMQALGGLIQTYVSPIILDWASKLNRGIDTAVNTSGSPLEKIRAGLNDAFDFDISTYDFAGAITKLFDSIAAAIDGFGVKGNYFNNPKVDAAITAFINGIVKVLGSISNKIAEKAMEDPIAFAKVAFILNPSAVLQFGILLVSLIPALISLGSLLWAIGGAILTGIAAVLAFVTTTVLGAVLLFVGIFIGLIAVVIVWREQLAMVGYKLEQFGGFMQTTVRMFGSVLSDLGQAGKRFKDAWDLLLQGNWQGALTSLFEGLMWALGATLKMILIPFVALGDLAFSSLKAGIEWLGSALVSLGSAIYNFLSKLASSAWNSVSNGASDMWNSASNAIGTVFSGMGAAFNDYVIKPIVSLLNSIPGFKAATGFIGQGISNNIEAGGTVINGIANAGAAGSKFIGDGFNSVKKLAGFADGNPLGGLLSSLAAEQSNTPSGFSPVFANSSEAIIPRSDATRAIAGLSSRGGNSISMTINNYAGDDITEKVRVVLESILGT